MNIIAPLVQVNYKMLIYLYTYDFFITKFLFKKFGNHICSPFVIFHKSLSLYWSRKRRLKNK